MNDQFSEGAGGVGSMSRDGILSCLFITLIPVAYCYVKLFHKQIFLTHVSSNHFIVPDRRIARLPSGELPVWGNDKCPRERVVCSTPRLLLYFLPKDPLNASERRTLSGYSISREVYVHPSFRPDGLSKTDVLSTSGLCTKLQ